MFNFNINSQFRSGDQQRNNPFTDTQQSSQSFGDNMNSFFSSVFNPSSFFGAPFMQSQQQQQQQQQSNQPFQGFQSSQQMNFSNNENRNSNRPNPQRQSSQNNQNVNQNRQPQQQQQQSSQQRQQRQQQQENEEELKPSFRSTRSNWKKSEETSSKKKEQPKENTSEYWKQKGNEVFKKGYLDTAIEYYSKAISIEPSHSIFFSNRGRCYKNKQDLKRAFDDAVQAIELDDKNLKGHLLCGQVLCEMGKHEQGYQKIENGIKKLTKGLTLCTSQAGEKQKQFEKEISVYIFRAKKLLYYKKRDEQRIKKASLIQNYCSYLDSLPSLSQNDKQSQLEDFIFTIGDPRKEKDLSIPEHLCCKITLDLMVDPVTTEAGHTYEREVVEEHFKKNGYIDPITRNKVKPTLYPNLSVKQGVEEFLQENPWAFEHSYQENFMKIEF